jgi:hypothetical protein
VKRFLLAAVLLSACAPAAVRPSMAKPGAGSSDSVPAIRPYVPPPVQAAFSSAGVIWNEGGKVTLARSPGFQKVPFALKAVATAVGWQTVDRLNTPWVGVGQLGWLLTADGRPVTVQVGRVVALSNTRAYRQDGSAVGFDGAALPGLLGTPDAVVTGGNGTDYALQNGKLYRLTESGPLLESGAARPFLYAEAGGASTANAPTLVTVSGRYTLTGTALERRDGAGALLASVPHPAGAIGEVGSLVVTVQPGGILRVFAPELRELKP